MFYIIFINVMLPLANMSMIKHLFKIDRFLQFNKNNTEERGIIPELRELVLISFSIRNMFMY